VKGRAAGVGSR